MRFVAEQDCIFWSVEDAPESLKLAQVQGSPKVQAPLEGVKVRKPSQHWTLSRHGQSLNGLAAWCMRQYEDYQHCKSYISPIQCLDSMVGIWAVIVLEDL